jgi:orc1/cdc6 family replication initiation protein
MTDNHAHIQTLQPLQPGYQPSELQNREGTVSRLKERLTDLKRERATNLLVQGPPGSGKTTVLRQALSENKDSKIIWIPCSRYRTQYRALCQICEELSGKDIGPGHHSADIERTITEHTGASSTIIVLDEIDFLLLNNGDNLLYFLSRFENSDSVTIVSVSSDMSGIEHRLDSRTYSSLYPEKHVLNPYSGDHIYEILAERARKSFAPKSLRREALTYISSATQNASFAIHWLKKAALEATDTITEETTQKVRDKTMDQYFQNQLTGFSDHHRTVYKAIKQLNSQAEKQAIQTGHIYKRYQQLVSKQGENPLSNRRISDFIKHLEILGLINAEYHYGGSKGKTREIQLNTNP